MAKRGVKSGTKRGSYNKNKVFKTVEQEYNDYRKRVYQKKYYLRTKYGVDVSKAFADEMTSLEEFKNQKEINGEIFEDVKKTTIREAYETINKESAEILSEKLKESDVEGAKGLTKTQIRYGQLNQVAKELWEELKGRTDISKQAKYEMVNALFGSD